MGPWGALEKGAHLGEGDALEKGTARGRMGFFEGGFERLRRALKCQEGLQEARRILDQGATVQYDTTSPPCPSPVTAQVGRAPAIS